MCGFVTIFSPQAGVQKDSLDQALKALDHRGPDSRSTWISPDGRVGLGHTRLSIIDLTTGEQPIANEDGSIQIVVNGEFYGFEAIRRNLEAAGHRFRTQSDSEIALHLYETYGTQCVHHLRGEFAFVIWDSRNQTLFAARDRFGIKPLHYARVGSTLYVASEAKALFAAGVPVAWDEEAVFQVNTSRLLIPGRTLFRDVFQVPPGHMLLATPHSSQLIKYWDFDYPVAGHSRIVSPEEALQAFRDKFMESVRIRLRADVPVGCYLSGGLDSCSILGIASKLSDRPIHAFTLSFESGAYDERMIAEEMAKFAGAPFDPLHVSAKDLADNFSDALWHGEMPFRNAHAVAKFLLSRHVRDRGFKVVLTGEGSDEILGGYTHFRRDWLLHNSSITDQAERERLLSVMDASNPVSRGLLQANGDDTALPHVRNLLGFVPSFMLTGSGSTASQDILARGFREQFSSYDPMRALFNDMDVRGQLQGREPVHQSLYLWSKTVLPTYLLSVLGDRMEMAHSVEGRVPFLDHELVELVTQIPVSEKIKAMKEKHLIREAAKPYITDTVYHREKHPFLAPPAASARDKVLNEFMNDTLRSTALDAIGIYDPKAVHSLLDQSERGNSETKAALDPELMMILSFTIMHQRFGVES